MKKAPLGHIDQSANELVLSIIRGHVNPYDLFNVLSEDKIHHRDNYIKAHIIGASHAICVKVGKIKFCEVFACVAPDIDKKRMVYGPLTDFNDETVSINFGENFKYKFNARITDWESGEGEIKEIEEKIENASKSPLQIGIGYDFPKSDSSIHIPKTLVFIEADNGFFINFKTVHSYPNENSIVFTDTVLIP